MLVYWWVHFSTPTQFCLFSVIFWAVFSLSLPLVQSVFFSMKPANFFGKFKIIAFDPGFNINFTFSISLILLAIAASRFCSMNSSNFGILSVLSVEIETRCCSHRNLKCFLFLLVFHFWCVFLNLPKMYSNLKKTMNFF